MVPAMSPSLIVCRGRPRVFPCARLPRQPGARPLDDPHPLELADRAKH
jgi:hypothetical protein